VNSTEGNVADTQLHPDQINKVTATKFSDMSGTEKLKFIGKVCIFIVTGGFAFPTIFSD
jgi:hypothetical protein